MKIAAAAPREARTRSRNRIISLRRGTCYGKLNRAHPVRDPLGMPSLRHDNLGRSPSLLSPAWATCEELIKSFEEAWQRGETPQIKDYLRAEGPERVLLLRELAHVDLELRLGRGEPARVEDYLQAHPELARD